MHKDNFTFYLYRLTKQHAMKTYENTAPAPQWAVTGQLHTPAVLPPRQ